ncbi:MAG: pyruvate ferredoxin oxidoreductase [Nitrospira sp.]|jgi:pyruvate ferredoxin oxidoreductase delta subunit|nr:pyruvate ferredoxin oxidoreductase [Nitrospira sp.]
MYNVAQVIDEKCVAKKGCRLCIMYCPEANCLDLNSSKMVAEVNIDRCKGCELCVVVCNAAKHMAIEMQAVSSTGELIKHHKAESAALGQAYQG